MIIRVLALAMSVALAGCTVANAPDGGSAEAVPSLAVDSAAPDPSYLPSSPTATGPIASPISTATPPPSGPFVEQVIVDRPGVPAAVYDKYWMVSGSWATFGQAGQLGTTARIVLPNELVLGADAGIVASYAVVKSDLGTEDPVVGPNGVTISVRDIRTGATLRAFETRVDPIHGLMTGKRLFWFGRSLPSETREGADPAIWGIDLADPESTPIEIIPAGEPAYGRSPLRLSDQGRVVMSNVGGLRDPGRVTQVIDVATMKLRTNVEGEIVYALGGGTALIARDDALVLRDLATGRRIGPALQTSERYKSFTGDGEAFIQYGPGGNQGVYITAIDLESGDARDILDQARGVRTTFMSPELSTSDLLVLFDDDWEFDENGWAYISLSLLDPATGELDADAVTIGSPPS